jgi:L-threonylcarbamoyladenylate synthase
MTADIELAASILEGGGLVAFPTETVYGLGADAENISAVAKIFLLKGRPANHPVIVHLSPEADLSYWSDAIPEEAGILVRSFWPGPLTLILRRAGRIPSAVSGGQDTVGLRCPSHPVAIDLLRAFRHGRGGIAAPSANKFGHVSPTTAAHVRHEFSKELGALLGAVLDGGQSAVGIESTIIDLSRMESHGPVLLRPGFIGASEIEAVLGLSVSAPDGSAPRASGTLASHYAPRTPVVLKDSRRIATLASQLRREGLPFTLLLHTMEEPPGAAAGCRLPSDSDGYAHGLYAALRELDDYSAHVILVENVPGGSSWNGVRDRLCRAAHGAESLLDYLL